MRVFDFHAPQERVEPKLWTNTQSFANVNAGRYVRNAILDGKTYPAGEQCPAWLKTRDAVHPFVGMQDKTADVSSDYGGAKASAALAVQILHPWNIVTWWTPGGNGVNSWIQVKLPEATLIGSYAVGSKAVNAPLSWKLQGSLDETTWTDVHVMENTGVWNATYEFKEFLIPEESRGAYLYYRLSITGSNSTSMSLRNFRLFRPSSICAKGQLLVDASALSPLIMSFADGFDTDGVTPIDHFKSITAASLLNMFDINGHTVVRGAPSTYNVPININAVLDPDTGAVSIETEDAGLGIEIVQANGGMVSPYDKGWEASNTYLLSAFGRYTPGSSIINTGQGPTYDSTFYLSSKNALSLSHPRYFPYMKIGMSALGSGASVSAWIIEPDGTQSPIGYNGDVAIGRFIKGIRIRMASNINYGCLLYGVQPRVQTQLAEYRMNNGKLYAKASSELPWTECHKVKIGTVILTTDGEVVQPLPITTMQNQLLS